MLTRGSVTPSPLEPAINFSFPQRCAAQMLNEVRPSTVETWLTIRREYSARDRSSHRGPRRTTNEDTVRG